VLPGRSTKRYALQHPFWMRWRVEAQCIVTTLRLVTLEHARVEAQCIAGVARRAVLWTGPGFDGMAGSSSLLLSSLELSDTQSQ